MFSTLFLALVSLCLSIKMVTPLFLALFWIISSCGMLASRLLIRYSLAKVRLHGRNLRYVVIIGTNQRAIEFAHQIQASPEQGYRILGFVDVQWVGTAMFNATGFQLVSDLANLAEYLRNNVVDEVAIYLPIRSLYTYAAQAAALCEQHGIIVRFDLDIFGLKTAKSRAEAFDSDHHIAAYSGQQNDWPWLAKRTLDIVGSSLLLLLSSPLLMIVALSIKLTSKGPAFFLQERVGLNKRRFMIYKFRTMVSGAERAIRQLEQQNEMSGPVFKIRNDPRITPIGKLLRRTSIDELPQLLNVLKGDMSLVGPRPLPLRDYQGFSEDWQRRRFSTRPGITCLWQVNGRNSISFEQWMKLDIQYLDEWSFWLDLKILARTIPAVLKGTGAA